MRLTESFYLRDARTVARDLLGQVLVTAVDGVRASGRIIETEAYLGVDDAASHAHRGETARNAAMFLAGGHAYLYLIYGMYWCFNVVTGPAGHGEAVLVRAIDPLEGVDAMRARRGALRSERELANGPGKLVIALGVTSRMNGADLVRDERVWIERGRHVDDDDVVTTPRIGITKAVEHEWRFIERARPGGSPARERPAPSRRRRGA
jgi:DNA-3-methyladenine glycosylase